MTTFIALAALLTIASLAWLLRPLRTAMASGAAPARRPRITFATLAVGVPLTALALYAWLGRVDAAGPLPADPDRAMAEERTTRLAGRLDASPDDAAGWRLLARSYEQLGRFAEATKARARLAAMQPAEADPMVDLAEAVSMTQGGSYVGEPIALVRRALAIDRDNPRALAIAANEAVERGDPAAAIGHWQHVLSLVPADSEVARSLLMNIADAQQPPIER